LRRRLLTLTTCALGLNAALAVPAPAATQAPGPTVTLPDGTKLAVPSPTATTQSPTPPPPPAVHAAAPTTTTPTKTAPPATSTHAATTPTSTSTTPTATTHTAPSILKMPATSSAPTVARPHVVAAKGQQVTGHETPTPDADGALFGSPAAAAQAAAAKAAKKPAVDPPQVGTPAVSGLPTAVSPAATAAALGVMPSDVPNFFIDSFDVPGFLLPIFQAAGVEYDVPWEVLAAINQVETDYGRNLNTSTAGAEGWMQFLPATWEEYGVDANGAGVEDPNNPADAIFAAARYLHAAGASKNLRSAIFAYNHADWYVDSVMLRARLIGGMPPDLVSSITGLTDGLFPVDATARYTDNAAHDRTSPIEIYAKAGAPVVAVKDGVVTALGQSPALGTYVKLRDAFGNTYIYSQLKKLAAVYTVPKAAATAKPVARAVTLPTDPTPRAPATAGHQAAVARTANPAAVPNARTSSQPVATDTTADPLRLFGHPTRPASFAAGGSEQIATSLASSSKSSTPTKATFKALAAGAHVTAGTILGRIGETGPTGTPHVGFQIRPAGVRSPEVDPTSILEGWQLLDATANYRSGGSGGPLFGPASPNTSIDQIVLETRTQLEQQVLADPSIGIYPQGRRDIEAGLVDQRVLANLAFLSASGLEPTVSAFAHDTPAATGLATPGHLSVDAPATTVDITAVNGVPILDHQGTNSITDTTIRRLLTLPVAFEPLQIISLMAYPSNENTVAQSDHADRISLTFAPTGSPQSTIPDLNQGVLTSPQWLDLIGRLGQIGNPTVAQQPSTAAIPDH
jgi:hypothetical protein